VLLLQEGKVNVSNVEEDKVLYIVRWSKLIYAETNKDTFANKLSYTVLTHGELIRHAGGMFHSFISNLSYDRSTASSKTIPPLNAI
jgi:hypothetical protein